MKTVRCIICMLLLTSITLLSFSSCSDKESKRSTKFIYEETESGLTILGYSGTEAEVTIPSSIEGKTVTTVAENAFNGMIGLKKIVIPDTVTTIDYAFIGCPELTSVEIGSSVTSMNGAFKDCKALTTVIGGGSVVYMAESFMNCTSLESGTIPSEVINANSAFNGCSSLSSVEISNGVQSLPFTFAGCTSLTSISLPNSVTSLLSTFENCTSLSSAEGLENVTSIDSAFKNCSSLTSLSLGENIDILKGAFINCSSLVSVLSLPESVTEYSASFTGCSSISNIIIPAVTGENGISNYLFTDDISGCISISTIKSNLPFLVTTEFCNTFSHCPKLTEVTLLNETAREFLRISYTYSDSIYEGTNSSVNKAVTNCKKNSRVRVTDDFGFIGKESYTHIYGGDVNFFDADELASSTETIGFEAFTKSYYWCGYPKGTNYKTNTVALERTYSFYLKVTGKNEGGLPKSVIVNGMTCTIES